MLNPKVQAWAVFAVGLAAFILPELAKLEPTWTWVGKAIGFLAMARQLVLPSIRGDA